MNIPRVGAVAVVLTSGPNAGKILIAGGQNTNTVENLASTELYDPATNSFASALQTASMNSARAATTAALITSGPNTGKILIAGGFGQPQIQLSSTDLYDPDTNTFAAGL